MAFRVEQSGSWRRPPGARARAFGRSSRARQGGTRSKGAGDPRAFRDQGARKRGGEPRSPASRSTSRKSPSPARSLQSAFGTSERSEDTASKVARPVAADVGDSPRDRCGQVCGSWGQAHGSNSLGASLPKIAARFLATSRPMATLRQRVRCSTRFCCAASRRLRARFLPAVTAPLCERILRSCSAQQARPLFSCATPQ